MGKTTCMVEMVVQRGLWLERRSSSRLAKAYVCNVFIHRKPTDFWYNYNFYIDTNCHVMYCSWLWSSFEAALVFHIRDNANVIFCITSILGYCSISKFRCNNSRGGNGIFYLVCRVCSNARGVTVVRILFTCIWSIVDIDKGIERQSIECIQNLILLYQSTSTDVENTLLLCKSQTGLEIGMNIPVYRHRESHHQIICLDWISCKVSKYIFTCNQRGCNIGTLKYTLILCRMNGL